MEFLNWGGWNIHQMVLIWQWVHVLIESEKFCAFVIILSQYVLLTDKNNKSI